jgi:hypothetical protein
MVPFNQVGKSQPENLLGTDRDAPAAAMAHPRNLAYGWAPDRAFHADFVADIRAAKHAPCIYASI